MKKSLLIFCALFISTLAFAGSPIRITSGKENVKAFLKEKVTIVLECDWSKAQFDKKKALKEELGEDYSFVVADCLSKFLEGYNEKSKALKMSADAAEAKYKFLLNVTNIDSYFAAMSFVPRWEGKMWGNFKIVNISDGSTLIEGEVDEAEDGTDFVRKECYGKTFQILGEMFAKLK